MALRPDMDTYAWNRLYVLLAAGLFPLMASAVADAATLRDVLMYFFSILGAASGICLAFIQEPKR